MALIVNLKICGKVQKFGNDRKIKISLMMKLIADSA
jgi:hypothetical protein